ncbi:MAG: Gfo/Idh/MocA family oxidoreductase [Candidatus Woesearchaeota archaeon]
MRKIPIAQVAYRSEWALAKFFDALALGTIQERFELVAVCGVEKTKEEAIVKLREEIINRVRLVAKTGFRVDQRIDEIQSSLRLLDQLVSKLEYHHVNNDPSLIDQFFASDFEAVVVHSRNITHLTYIDGGIKAGKHVLCEKPLIPVLNQRGKPYHDDIAELEDIVRKAPPNCVLMDSEHYSYKQASLVFYENFPKILGGKKIKRVEGELAEIDDPGFGRTKEILSQENCTGLMGDTLCHLLAFISNLGAKPVPVQRKYGNYSGYGVDTYDVVDFEVRDCPDYFTNDAIAQFRVVKFIDLLQTPEKDEKKYIKFTLDDDTEIKLDFRDGEVTKTFNGTTQPVAFRYIPYKNEYVNILNTLYESIVNGTQPRTTFTHSLATLNAIHQAYCLPSANNIHEEVYKPK